MSRICDVTGKKPIVWE